MNESDPEACLSAARGAQRQWRARSLRARCRLTGAVRHRLAADAPAFVAAVGDRFDRGAAETLTAELIPLADAARFIARRGPRILASRHLGRRGRPAWLMASLGDVRRIPFGVVGIIAPGNYRLLLAGVQMLQALAAGNAVLIKPAPGAAAPLALLRDALIDLGVPADLIQILADDHAVGAALAAAPIDKLVLTGSAATGRAVAAALAKRGVPAALELSGNDAVFVADDADLDRVAASLAWGLGLNGGASCIAPRRIFVSRTRFEALAERLDTALREREARRLDPVVGKQAIALIAGAERAGWRVLGHRPNADSGRMAPCILADARADDETQPAPLPGDLFAPAAALIAVNDMAQAIARDAESDYALGASIFGDETRARTLAERLDAGIVTINDLIAPTADPRAPFSGARASGHGVTRGAEGLRAMTRPQTVLWRRGRARPHLAPAGPHDRDLFAAYLRLAHGQGLRARLSALGDLVYAVAAHREGQK